MEPLSPDAFARVYSAWLTTPGELRGALNECLRAAITNETIAHSTGKSVDPGANYAYCTWFSLALTEMEARLRANLRGAEEWGLSGTMAALYRALREHVAELSSFMLPPASSLTTPYLTQFGQRLAYVPPTPPPAAPTENDDLTERLRESHYAGA
jgi:hypothetical protein